MALCLSPDARRIAFTTDAPLVRVLDGETLETVWEDTAGAPCHSALIAPDRGELILGHIDGLLQVRDLATDAVLGRWIEPGQDILALSLSPDGRQLAVGIGRGDIVLLERDGLQELRWFAGSTEGTYTVAYSPDGTRLVSGGLDRRVRVHDVTNGAVLLALDEASSGVAALAFSADGQRLFAISRLRFGPDQLYVWDAAPRARDGR